MLYDVLVTNVTFVKVTAELEALINDTLCVTDNPTFVSGKVRLDGDAATLPPMALPSSRTV